MKLTKGKESMENGMPQWLVTRRNAALQKQQELLPPLYQYGLGITLDLRFFDRKLFKEKDERATIVHLPKSIAVSGKGDFFEKYGERIQEWWFKEKEIVTFFDAAHIVETNHTLCVDIPDHLQEQEPIKLITQLEATRFENIFFHAGKQSKVLIEDISSAIAKEMFHSKRVYLILEEGAQVIYHAKQSLGKQTYQMQKKYAKLAKGSTIEWNDEGKGGKIVQIATKTELEDEEAAVISRSLFCGREDECFDISAEAIHNAPSTKSDLHTRTIVDGKARAIYRGLIHIRKDAKNCQGFQRDDILLLSEDARADTVPNLEINNNDVKCHHSATITHLDEEKLFYLMSRGISRQEGKKLLIDGFAEPFFQRIQRVQEQ